MTVALESPLLPMLDDLGPSETIMMSALGPAWQTLAGNMKVVEKLARSAHSRAKAGESATQEELERVDLKLAALHSLLGERPEAFGTQTAFAILTEVMGQLEELADGFGKELQAALNEMRQNVADGISARLSDIVTQQIKTQVFGGRFYTELVIPAAALVKRCSSGPSQGGDLWEGRLAALERGLDSIKKMNRPSTVGPWSREAMEVEEPASAWGGGRLGVNIPTPPRASLDNRPCRRLKKSNCSGLLSLRFKDR